MLGIGANVLSMSLVVDLASVCFLSLGAILVLLLGGGFPWSIQLLGVWDDGTEVVGACFGVALVSRSWQIVFYWSPI